MWVNALALVMTVYDKYASKHRPRRRVSERPLLSVVLLGEAGSM
ncbi:DUF1294 domain-containing protein [Suicoccus acidiformans]